MRRRWSACRDLPTGGPRELSITGMLCSQRVEPGQEFRISLPARRPARLGTPAFQCDSWHARGRHRFGDSGLRPGGRLGGWLRRWSLLRRRSWSPGLAARHNGDWTGSGWYGSVGRGLQLGLNGCWRGLLRWHGTSPPRRRKSMRFHGMRICSRRASRCEEGRPLHSAWRFLCLVTATWDGSRVARPATRKLRRARRLTMP